MRRLGAVLFALTMGCRFDTGGLPAGSDDGGPGDGPAPPGDAPPGFYMLSVLRSGDGAGTVTSSPPGIDCGSTCAASFPAQSVVTLTALSDPLSTFVGWNGICSGSGSCVVTLDGPAQAEAVFAQRGGLVWARRFGSVTFAAAHDVAIGPTGDVYVTGYCSGTADLGGGPTTDRGGQDLFVARYAADGTFVWARRVGGTGTDQGRSLAVAGDGDVYVVGYSTSSSIDMGGVLLPGAGQEDVIAARYRGTDGALVWAKRYGDSGTQVGYGITVTPDGLNVVLTGVLRSAADFGAGLLAEAGGGDIFVVRLAAADGVTVWSRRYGASGSDFGTSVAVDGDGNIILGGAVSGTVVFDAMSVVANAAADILLAKLSPTGNVTWAFAFGGTGTDSAQQVDVAGTDVFMTGQYTGPVDLGAGPLPDTMSPDVFVARYDAAGTLRWAMGRGGPGADVGLGIAVAGGAVVTTGTFASSINLGGPPHAGATDVYVVKYSADTGAWIWDHAYGSAGEESGNGVAIDALGNVAIAGMAEGPIDLGGGPIPQLGARDAYVARLRP